MQQQSQATLDQVKNLIAETLGLEDRAASMDASTPLLGEIPELDSLAVVEIAAGIEDRFHFQVDDTNFTADVFETLGSLTSFVDANRQ
jgi:acyl carrier protein